MNPKLCQNVNCKNKGNKTCKFPKLCKNPKCYTAKNLIKHTPNKSNRRKLDKIIKNNKIVQNVSPYYNGNTKTNIIKTVMSYSEMYNNNLPLINIKFGKLTTTALLDSGANLSLMHINILTEIKQYVKVNYLSRSVKIKTINNSEIPYMSTVKLKFKIEGKWFENIFFCY